MSRPEITAAEMYAEAEWTARFVKRLPVGMQRAASQAKPDEPRSLADEAVVDLVAYMLRLYAHMTPDGAAFIARAELAAFLAETEIAHCPSCKGTGYVRFRPAEYQHPDDYCQQDCSTCRPARQRRWELQQQLSTNR